MPGKIRRGALFYSPTVFMGRLNSLAEDVGLPPYADVPTEVFICCRKCARSIWPLRVKGVRYDEA